MPGKWAIFDEEGISIVGDEAEDEECSAREENVEVSLHVAKLPPPDTI